MKKTKNSTNNSSYLLFRKRAPKRHGMTGTILILKEKA